MKTSYGLFLAAAFGLALTASAQEAPKTAPAQTAPAQAAQKPDPPLPPSLPIQDKAPAPVHTPGPVPAPPIKNVLADAAVGEWLEYAVRMDTTAKGTELKARQTVTAKDAKYVTLKTSGDLGTHDLKISLTVPYEPYMPVGETDAIAQKLKEGKETLTIRGKTYACDWVLVRVHGTMPTETNCETKVWTCKDVPVTGVVKLESVSTAAAKDKTVKTKLTMELTGSGKQE